MVAFINSRTVVSPCFLESNELPVSKLAEDLKSLRSSLMWSAERDCRQFVKFVQQWKYEKLYQHFSPTWEEFVKKQLGKPLEWIELMVEGANYLNMYEGVVTADTAVAVAIYIRLRDKSGRPYKVTPEQFAVIHSYSKSGKTQREIADIVGVSQKTINRVLSHNSYTYNDYDSNTRSPKQRGTSVEYRQARLDRDHPELAQQVKQGEITLASACKKVGIAKRIIAEFKIDEDRTPFSLAKSMTERLSLEFINDLYSELGKLIQEHHNEHNWIP